MKGRVRLCSFSIDVSSQTLEVASSAQAKSRQVTNNAGGIEQLVSQASALPPALGGAGGHEWLRARGGVRAASRGAVVNPRTARDFVCGMEALAKTDALGARMLAAFAHVLHQDPERECFVKRWPMPNCSN